MSTTDTASKPAFATPQHTWDKMRDSISEKKTEALKFAELEIREFLKEQRREALRILRDQPPKSFQELFKASLFKLDLVPQTYSYGLNGQTLHVPNCHFMLAETHMITEPRHNRNDVTQDYNVLHYIDHMADLCDFVFYCMRELPEGGVATCWRTTVGHIWGASFSHKMSDSTKRVIEGVLRISGGPRMDIPYPGHYLLRA